MEASVFMDKYIFKIVILGTSDQLKEEFLSLISQKSWHVDGVSGHKHTTDGVSIDIWFPKDDASSKILVNFSFRNANGALIVMGRKDRRILRRFVKTIRDEIGDVPYVGIVIRKSMTEPEKGIKALHAVKILSDKMKMYSGSAKEFYPESQSSPPQVIAGKPSYNVDEFGFVISNSEGIPLFAKEADEEEEEDTPRKSHDSYT